VSTAVVEKKRRRRRRQTRIRGKISGTNEVPRLSLYRSNRGVFAQLVDDDKGQTVVAVSWTEPELRKLSGAEQAKRAGELLADRAKAAGITTCVFDRSGYKYHGRVKALADGAREGGLSF
jgi:large subunit ribosomal protein L18